MRTSDLEEAIEAVTKVLCPHRIEVAGRGRTIDAVLKVARPTTQPLVELSYGAAVKIETGMRLSLMMHCSRGSALASQENRSGEWRRGQTMPFSAGLETALLFDETCVQRSVALDASMLETHCARWLGRPLMQPLQLSLRPFSDELERVWQRTLSYLWSNDEGALPLSDVAKAAFDEYLVTLLLHQHPHNYSDEIAQTERGAVPGLVRRAERFMVDNAETPITVSDVAAELGISVRSLQAGFHQWRSTTPMAVLRSIRLQRARDDLLRSDGEVDVTTVALRYGFSHLGRFSAYYRASFGEAPRETLRRSRLSRWLRVSRS